MIALGALFKVYGGNTFDIAAHTNIGRRKKWIALISIPVLIVLLSIFRIVDIKLEPIDFVQFAVLFVLYAVFSSYVQMFIEKETIMKRQHNEMERRISDQLRELDSLANQDKLTALYNQSYFAGCIDETVSSLLPNETMALMVIDLDRFKTINGRFGYEVGDIVLIEIARRLAECNEWGAVISHFGGDEFGVLVVGNYTRKEIEDICDRIIGICKTPISAGGESLEVTMSMGVALYSPEACERGTLFKNADIAMYSAKSQGYNKYLFYDPLLAEKINRKNTVEVLLRQAVLEKDFQLFYQPQYSLPNLKLIGAEALIRWKNMQHGYIPPSVFIPVAEEIDYILRLGRWVVREAVRQAVEWNELFMSGLKIGFNISPKQLKDETFIDFLKAQISETNVNTTWLDAEITENVMIDSKNATLDVLGAMRELGITVSIDDFGSGYSSLGYLNKHIFDRIKIDRSLISAVSTQNTGGINVVKAVINMAKAVGITTIAEGIETQEQLDILTELGCDQAQGYLLGRPVPVPVFERMFIIGNHISTAQYSRQQMQ